MFNRLTSKPVSPVLADDGLADGESRRGLDEWKIWQLADSAFPTGGFAHSGGLEAAWQQGEIQGRNGLAAFLETSLNQFAHSMLPIMVAAFEEPERLVELDNLCDCFTSNHVANRASRFQGQALLASTERIYALPPLTVLRASPEHEPPCGHLAPVFGVVMRALEMDRESAARLFCFLHLRGLVSSAVRLGIAGPLEAQAIQSEMGPRSEAILQRCLDLSVEDIAQTAPMIDVWQGAQDRLYSRLFQS